MAKKTLQINIQLDTENVTRKEVYGMVIASINQANNYGLPVTGVTLDNVEIFNDKGFQEFEL
jgi:hypothetical protein